MDRRNWARRTSGHVLDGLCLPDVASEVDWFSSGMEM
jgi:hypothetical protein